MSKLFLGVVVLGLLVMPLAAQDYPKAEIFGGYQYTHISADGSGVGFNGWNASLTGNVNKYLGVTADFSGAYKSESGASLHIYSYTFGPTISLNHEGTVNPFVHALFGGATASASAFGSSGSTNGFTMMAGGGADAKLSPHFAVRLFQGDWVYYRFSGVSGKSNVRISAGVVARF